MACQLLMDAAIKPYFTMLEKSCNRLENIFPGFLGSLAFLSTVGGLGASSILGCGDGKTSSLSTEKLSEIEVKGAS